MKKFLFIILLLSFVSCSTGIPAGEIKTAIVETESIDAEPPPTIVPTEPLPSPTPPPPPCNLSTSKNNDWTTIVCEEFESDTGGWGSSVSGDLASSVFKVENSKLAVDFTSKNTQSFTSGVVQRLNISEAKDFTLSVKGNIISKFDQAEWGVAFRGESDSYYLLMFSNFGTYILQQLKNNTWTDLLVFKAHSAIRWEEENELTLVVDGDRFEIYMNGELINSYESSSLSGLDINLAVGAAEGVVARFEFDDLIIKQKQ